MCYEERLLRSWTMKKAQQRAENQPVTERDRSQVTPIRTTPTPETQRPREVEREVEEIV